MRQARGGVGFAGLIGATGIGAYLGAAAAGLLSVVMGHALATGSPWPGGAVVLALIGAIAGGLVAGLTGLARTLRWRTLALTAGGLLSLPLAAAIGQLHQVATVGIGLVALGGAAGVMVYIAGRPRRPAGQAVARQIRAG